MSRLVIALVCLAVGTLAGGRAATAGVTYDLVFRGTDVAGQAIAGGSADGASFDFVGVAEARACDPGTGVGCPVADVRLRTTVELTALSTSVGFDDGGGLAVQDTVKWGGLDVPVTGMTTRYFGPLYAVEVTFATASSRSSFHGAVLPVEADGGLPPGTYHIGTVVWDTSQVQAGEHPVSTFSLAGFDGTGELPPGSGTAVDVTGSEVFGAGVLRVAGTSIPLPALSPLGLGLLAVALLLTAGRAR